MFCREKVDIIPSFIVNHYDKTGENKLPLPRVQKTKKVGNTVQHKLVYENNPNLDVWVPLSEYTDLGDTVSLSCRTEKDKDKRTHRYFLVYPKFMTPPPFQTFRRNFRWFLAMWCCNLF